MSSAKPESHGKILIAGDHAGVELKAYLIANLKPLDFVDLGPATSQSVDYPDYAEKVASSISKNPKQFGILICGSGVGMCIAANRHPHVRAALAWNSEIAKLSREHNDANILCLPARFISPEEAVAITRTWLETSFSGESRHVNRVNKLG